MLDEFINRPHAWCKLWKHHGAGAQAERIDTQAGGEDWFAYYGGRISSEYLLPKALETLECAPEVYAAADRFMEAGDWLVWQLCGNPCRSNCAAGFKSFWEEGKGYPSEQFLGKLNPAFASFAQEKLRDEPAFVGQTAGKLLTIWAGRLGIPEGIPVAVPIIDAHASMAGCGIADAGKLLMIIGTSTCHILLDRDKRAVPGINGVVKNGIIEGLYAYEAGQCCVGDSFSWYMDNCLPESYICQAHKEGKSLHEFLRERAQRLLPGQSGLIALDWLNGVRSPRMDFDLSGMVLGLSLETKPEEIYRALIESTAFGAKTIVDGFIKSGVEIHELYATGGIAAKDPMTMQIYADVLGKPVQVAGGSYSGARGSAIYAALAVERQRNPQAEMCELVERLGNSSGMVFTPSADSVAIYSRLYEAYCATSDFFGDTRRDLMQSLKVMKMEANVVCHSAKK